MPARPASLVEGSSAQTSRKEGIAVGTIIESVHCRPWLPLAREPSERVTSEVHDHLCEFDELGIRLVHRPRYR